MDTLTAKIWPNSVTNRWEGEPFRSNDLEVFTKRLESILELRTSHELLLQLLTDDDLEDAAKTHAFTAFDSINPLSCSNLTEKRWMNASERYNELIEPLEVLAGKKLQDTLHKLSNQPNQLLREFQKYKDIIKRKRVSQHLGFE